MTQLPSGSASGISCAVGLLKHLHYHLSSARRDGSACWCQACDEKVEIH